MRGANGVISAEEQSMAFRIETDEEEYRLIGPGGEVGPEIEYGCHAVVDVDGVCTSR